MQHHPFQVNLGSLPAWCWAAALASLCSGCATAVELDPATDPFGVGPPPPVGRGGGTGGGADVRGTPSSGGQAGFTFDASLLDREDERPALDERPAVAEASVEDVVSCEACVLRVQYRAGDTNPTDNQIKPQLNIINRGSVAVPLVELTMRYWLAEGSTPQMFFCDYALIGCASLQGQFRSLPAPRPRADQYLEIGFTAAAGTLAPANQTGEIQARCQKADFSPYQEADDYSFDPAATAFADAPHVTLYRQGVLVWGAEP
jgi:hypothetical protein